MHYLYTPAHAHLRALLCACAPAPAPGSPPLATLCHAPAFHATPLICAPSRYTRNGGIITGSTVCELGKPGKAPQGPATGTTTPRALCSPRALGRISAREARRNPTQPRPLSKGGRRSRRRSAARPVYLRQIHNHLALPTADFVPVATVLAPLAAPPRPCDQQARLSLQTESGNRKTPRAAP